MLAGGAAVAGAVSILRVTAILAAAAPQVLLHLVAAVLGAAAVLAVAGLALLRRGVPGKSAPELRNPFDLGPLLLFAAAFAAVSVLGGWLSGRIGDLGVLLASGLAGLLDVDVATLTAARLAGTAVTETVAAQAILLALGVNAGARVVYAMGAGPLGYWLRLLLATGAALGIGAAVAAMQGLLQRP